MHFGTWFHSEVGSLNPVQRLAAMGDDNVHGRNIFRCCYLYFAFSKFEKKNENREKSSFENF